jgi:hypothetical protein
MMVENQEVLNLVPTQAATNTAVRSGNWSNPGTWKGGLLPGANANVYIPQGITVTVDSTNAVSLRTIRDDGTLQFVTNKNTSLLVDTIVVTDTGNLIMGTPSNPIQSNVQAEIEFADRGPINLNWDPHQFSRGLISMGTTSIYGAAVTPYEALAVSPHKGDTTLVLANQPTNWRVGDQLVLTGTNPLHNEDEAFQILGISGKDVHVRALNYDHIAPMGMSVYVEDTTRNVVFESQDTTNISRHGHVMFMHTDNESIFNAGFYYLGRTDKSRPIDDPQFDADGKLIPGTGLNPRGRYALHFHHDGIDSMSMPIMVEGCAVVGSPGWGYVNHSSNVDFEYNVAFNVTGAAFVTEAGDEIGTFHGNMAVHSTGCGFSEAGGTTRDAQQDFGAAGHGFWFQGAGISVEDNIAAGQADTGFMYFTRGLNQKGLGVTQFLAANLVDPAIAHGQATIDVGQVPIREFTGNIAFAEPNGFSIWRNLLQADPTAESIVDNMKVWNTSRGFYLYHNAQFTVENSIVIGNPRWGGYGIVADGATRGLTYLNDTVTGCTEGIDLPHLGANHIIGGYYNDLYNIIHRGAADTSFSADVSSTTRFGNLTGPIAGSTHQYDFYEIFHREVWDIPSWFSFQGTISYAGRQLYAREQAPSYVPFPPGKAMSYVPSELIGKTNQQLWDLYGLAIGGVMIPPDATPAPRTQGFFGSPVKALLPVTLVSPRTTNVLQGYQLTYLDSMGHRVVDPRLVNLQEGWNLITRTIGGRPRSFLVYANTIPPTVAVNPSATLVINPAKIYKPFTLPVDVQDGTGKYLVIERFKNLLSLPQHKLADGRTVVTMTFTVWDRLFTEMTTFSVDITLDPTAPLT